MILSPGPVQEARTTQLPLGLVLQVGCTGIFRSCRRYSCILYIDYSDSTVSTIGLEKACLTSAPSARRATSASRARSCPTSSIARRNCSKDNGSPAEDASAAAENSLPASLLAWSGKSSGSAAIAAAVTAYSSGLQAASPSPKGLECALPATARSENNRMPTVSGPARVKRRSDG